MTTVFMVHSTPVRPGVSKQLFRQAPPLTRLRCSAHQCMLCAPCFLPPMSAYCVDPRLDHAVTSSLAPDKLAHAQPWYPQGDDDAVQGAQLVEALPQAAGFPVWCAARPFLLLHGRCYRCAYCGALSLFAFAASSKMHVISGWRPAPHSESASLTAIVEHAANVLTAQIFLRAQACCTSARTSRRTRTHLCCTGRTSGCTAPTWRPRRSATGAAGASPTIWPRRRMSQWTPTAAGSTWPVGFCIRYTHA